MKVTLRIWRQANAQSQGKMVSYPLEGVSEDMSFLEMLDMLNEVLTERGEEPVAFDHDCREGICGMCGVVINGIAHGGQHTTTCQLHMRSFADGATFDNATCIGCGACVAACPNGSAMLFTSAKITHLAMLPQGQPERYSRVKSMVAQHDEEGFGGCTNIGECAQVCPKGIPLASISQLNRDLMKSLFRGEGKNK